MPRAADRWVRRGRAYAPKSIDAGGPVFDDRGATVRIQMKDPVFTLLRLAKEAGKLIVEQDVKPCVRPCIMSAATPLAVSIPPNVVTHSLRTPTRRCDRCASLSNRRSAVGTIAATERSNRRMGPSSHPVAERCAGRPTHRRDDNACSQVRRAVIREGTAFISEALRTIEVRVPEISPDNRYGWRG